MPPKSRWLLPVAATFLAQPARGEPGAQGETAKINAWRLVRRNLDMIALKWLRPISACWCASFVLTCALALNVGADEGKPAPVNSVMKLISDLSDSDKKVRDKAARALWELGPKAAEAMPALVKVYLKDPDEGVRNWAAYALKAIGPAAEPPLIRALDSKKAEERARAAHLLGWLNLDKQKAAAVGPLMKLLKDESPVVRIGAVRALGRIGDPVAVSAVIGLVERDSNKFVRAWGIEALRYFHSDAKDAVPILIEILKNPDDPAWGVAFDSLGSIGKDAVLPLVKLMNDKRLKLEVRRKAIWILRSIAGNSHGEDAEGAVPALIDTLKDEELRGAAFDALEHTGKYGKPAIPALVELLKSVSPSQRILIARALYRIDPRHPKVVPVMLEGLQDKDPKVRSLAAHDIGLGPKAPSAVPALIKLLKDKNPDVRLAAAGALWHIGPAAKAAIPALKEALEDEDESVRHNARHALESIGAKK